MLEFNHIDRDDLVQLCTVCLDLLSIMEEDGRIVALNAAWETTLGWKREELIDRPVMEFLHIDDVLETEHVYSEMRKTGSPLLPIRGFTNRYKCRNGSYRWLQWSSVIIISKAGKRRFYSTARDVTDLHFIAEENERLRTRLEKAALTDELTGLMNRAGGNQALARMVARRADRDFAVMLVDVDKFKDVNDGFGHSVGDAVLVRIGRMLSAEARASDFVCRWGGDEFLVVLEGSDIEGAEFYARRIIQALTWRPPDPPGRVTISVGISKPKVGETAKELIARADRAMYESKSRGGNFASTILD